MNIGIAVTISRENAHFPETCSTVSSVSKKFSNLFHAGNWIKLHTWLKAFSVTEISSISRQEAHCIHRFYLKIASLKCLKHYTFFSRLWCLDEKFCDAIFSIQSPLSLILFLMLAFSQYLWRQSKYSSFFEGVIRTERMDDNSRMFIVSKLFQR